jgi:hypothetical protein
MAEVRHCGAAGCSLGRAPSRAARRRARGRQTRVRLPARGVPPNSRRPEVNTAASRLAARAARVGRCRLPAPIREPARCGGCSWGLRSQPVSERTARRRRGPARLPCGRGPARAAPSRPGPRRDSAAGSVRRGPPSMSSARAASQTSRARPLKPAPLRAARPHSYAADRPHAPAPAPSARSPARPLAARLRRDDRRCPSPSVRPSRSAPAGAWRLRPSRAAQPYGPRSSARRPSAKSRATA